MTRRPDWIPPRTAIPAAAQREVFARSGGMCEAEGCAKVGKEIDHVKAVALGGTNDPDNLRLLCRAHHAEKSKSDVAEIARADRKGGRSGQYSVRKRAKAAGKHRPIKSAPMPGTKASGWRKPMNGPAERRDA